MTQQTDTGSVVRWHRKQLGLSTKDLADRLDVSVRTIQKWESGSPVKSFVLDYLSNLLREAKGKG